MDERRRRVDGLRGFDYQVVAMGLFGMYNGCITNRRFPEKNAQAGRGTARKEWQTGLVHEKGWGEEKKAEAVALKYRQFISCHSCEVRRDSGPSMMLEAGLRPTAPSSVQLV